MAINPAMLLLSAANPGLLPLAFSADSMSNYLGHSSTVRHSGNVTHEFHENSASRLQGYRVDAESAARVYASGVAAIDSLVAEFSSWIALHDEKIDSEEKKQDLAASEQLEKFYQQRKKEQEENEELSKLPAQIHQAKSNAKKTFWGFYDKDDLQKINKLEDRLSELKDKKMKKLYEMPDYSWATRIGYRQPRASEEIEALRLELIDKQKVAEISVGTIPLSFEDAKELADINANPKELVMSRSIFKKLNSIASNMK